MLSMSQVAAAAGVARYRIRYALETGALQEPQRLAGRRSFAPEDVERIRKHFAARGSGTRGQQNGRGKEAF